MPRDPALQARSAGTACDCITTNAASYIMKYDISNALSRAGLSRATPGAFRDRRPCAAQGRAWPSVRRRRDVRRSPMPSSGTAGTTGFAQRAPWRTDIWYHRHDNI